MRPVPRGSVQGSSAVAGQVEHGTQLADDGYGTAAVTVSGYGGLELRAGLLGHVGLAPALPAPLQRKPGHLAIKPRANSRPNRPGTHDRIEPGSLSVPVWTLADAARRLVPNDCIQAIVYYTSRTPTHGDLSEAFVVAVEPVKSEGPASLRASRN